LKYSFTFLYLVRTGLIAVTFTSLVEVFGRLSYYLVLLDLDAYSNTCLSCILARYQGTARLMFNSFASSLWMMPFSKYCRTDNSYCRHFAGGFRKGHHTYQCEEQEFRLNYSGWPTNIVNIEIPSVRGKTLEFHPMMTLLLFCSYASRKFNLQALMPIHQLPN
jgi:hypothetical protein